MRSYPLVEKHRLAWVWPGAAAGADPALVPDWQRQANARIFEEDRTVLEAQQQAIDARPGQALRNLNINAGSLWARRLIDGMLALEHESRAEQP